MNEIPVQVRAIENVRLISRKQKMSSTVLTTRFKAEELREEI